MDRDASQLSVLAANAGRRLWEDWKSVSLPLRVALERPRSGGERDFADIDLIGGRVRYWSRDPDVVDVIAARFGRPSGRRRSPDVVIEVETGADLERLHRTVDAPRSGVWACDPDGARRGSLSAHLPVLPPLELEPWRHRFWGLHSAAWIESDRGAILLCGEQRVGKTTVALAAHSAGLELLTDELVLVDRLDCRAWGVPLPMGVRGESDRVWTTEPLASGGRSANIAAVIVIARTPTASLDRLPVQHAIRILQPHVRECGLSPLASAAAVQALADTVPVYARTAPSWPALQSWAVNLVQERIPPTEWST